MTGYEKALNILNGLSDHARSTRLNHRLSGKDRTNAWLRLLGIKEEQLRRIRWVHVAGTKGKGTTCLHVNAILSRYQMSSAVQFKFACLTSPHVMDIRERLRIDGIPISKDRFATYVAMVWNTVQPSSDIATSSTRPPCPGFPGFLTLLSLFAMVREEVDIAVVETGIGGERDSTNVIPNPTAVGITTLGYDHTDVLGENIGSIAWHKAGIFKKGCQAVVLPQQEAATEILRHRAREREVDGEVRIVSAATADQYNVELSSDLSYQRLNASLGIELATSVLKAWEPSFAMSAELAQAVQHTEFPGKSELLIRNGNGWFLSSAHDQTSIAGACEWIRESVRSTSSPRIVLFSHKSKRDPRELLATLYSGLCVDDFLHPSHIIVCSSLCGFEDEKPDFRDARNATIPNEHQQQAVVWEELSGHKVMEVAADVRQAVSYIERRFRGADVLVIGSVYLAGAVRYLLYQES